MLQARLGSGLGLRAPVSVDELTGVPTKALRAAVRVVEWIDRLDEWGLEVVPPHRYCWPPVERSGG